MHFTGQIYRPPTEAETPMLEVTSGCSHNKCAFCDMYRNSPFCVAPLWQVEQDLQELAQSGQVQDRIYLTGGDPFILSADKLRALAKLIRQYLPQVQTLTCYCSIRDLMGKTDAELCALRAAGYNHLFVGLETGYPPAVEMINKGHTLEEAHPQNAVAVEGFFRDKAGMIAAIRTELAEIGDDILDSVLKRGSM